MATAGFDPTRALLSSFQVIRFAARAHRLKSMPLRNICTVIHTDADPVISAEVNSDYGLLGLGVAPRFLQKVRAQAPKF